MVLLSPGSEAKSNRNECLPRTSVTFWFGDQNLARQNAKINLLIWAQMRPLSNSQVKYFQYSQFNYLVLFFPAHWSFIKLWVRTINVHRQCQGYCLDHLSVALTITNTEHCSQFSHAPCDLHWRNARPSRPIRPYISGWEVCQPPKGISFPPFLKAHFLSSNHIWL